LTGKTRKLMVQAIALVMTMLAVGPVYIGLQGGSDGLAWAGLLLAAAGMGLGLWIG
jgi:hypothetical protein